MDFVTWYAVLQSDLSRTSRRSLADLQASSPLSLPDSPGTGLLLDPLASVQMLHQELQVSPFVQILELFYFIFISLFLSFSYVDQAG